MEEGRVKIDLVKVLILVFAVIALGLLAYSLYEVFRPNPYGNQIVIDNFSDYFGDAPRDDRDKVFAALYDIVESNADANSLKDMPASGAMIRDGSAENIYNKEENLHVGNFIVDMESIGQSYSGHFEWSSDVENIYFSGYVMLYVCLDRNDLIYGDFECRDIFSSDVTTKFPVTQNLPYTVEYYSDNYTNYTKYELFYDVNVEMTELTIRIVDYTGGNYQNALEKIKSFGYDMDDFKIEYEDKSAQEYWPKTE